MTRVRVFTVDGGVAIGPHGEEFFPDSRDDVGRPEKACVAVGRDLELAEVLVLKARPFKGHATLEDLALAKCVLLGDKFVECARIVEFIEGYIIEPSVDAIE